MILAEAPHADTAQAAAAAAIPHLVWVTPFALLLLCIAILPLIKKTEHWWHLNRNKLIVALLLGLVTLADYQVRGSAAAVHDHWLAHLLDSAGLDVHTEHGHTAAGPGLATTLATLGNALMEYIPFISLLFSLYVISGGIGIKGDIPAHPITNVAFLAIGGLLASLIGTTGASMLLIRPLLKTNSERKHVKHTVIFFIFVVSNIGGTLLPIGDPPLFLGYLKGVDFLWTLGLWLPWAFTVALLLVIYWVWDTIAYKKEKLADLRLDETRVRKISLHGKVNFLFLAGVVFATGTLSPGKPFMGIEDGWVPFQFCRELVQMGFVLLSLAMTPGGLRKENNFNYVAILEVACLFIGIFVCMQVPIEILNAKGGELGIDSPAKFFWATGLLSSCLDNAPTYVVFFETAKAMATGLVAGAPDVVALAGGSLINESFLAAISLGAVFMGANTYIGNGPNFMVKSIAEHEGVRMPSFFGYMLFSACVLIPVFVLVTILFV